MIIEFTPRGLLSVFFRQQFKFWLVFLLIVASGIYYLQNAKPLYEAYGSLLVRFGESASPDIKRPDNRPSEFSPSDRGEMVQSNMEILRSYTLLQSVVNDIGVTRLYPSDDGMEETGEASAGKETPVEAAVKRLIFSDLNVKSNAKSNIIEIRVMNEDPKLAAEFIGKLMDKFIARQMEVYNQPQLEFLSQQVKQAHDRLETSQQTYHAFKNKVGISSIEDELTQLLKEKSEVATISFKSVTEAQTRLSELQAKETELLSTYHANSPVVEQIRESIALAKRQLRERQNEMNASSSGALSLQVGNIDARINELESQRKHYNDLLRQVQIDEENYKIYQTRFEEARINETLNQEKITRITVVDEPIMPSKPVRPRKKLIFAMCLLAAMLCGLGVALAFETLDERFSTPEQLSRALKIPVLASFSAQRKG